jgi:hypothetical protein
VDIERNIVGVELADGVKPETDAVTRAVRGSGFKPRFMWARTRDAEGREALYELDTRDAHPAWRREVQGIEASFESRKQETAGTRRTY